MVDLGFLRFVAVSVDILDSNTFRVFFGWWWNTPALWIQFTGPITNISTTHVEKKWKHFPLCFELPMKMAIFPISS